MPGALVSGRLRRGLVTRRRDPENRRNHHVELTDGGEAAFNRLLETVTAFDAQLRSGLSDKEIAALSDVLGRLCVNVADPAGEVTS